MTPNLRFLAKTAWSHVKSGAKPREMDKNREIAPKVSKMALSLGLSPFFPIELTQNSFSELKIGAGRRLAPANFGLACSTFGQHLGANDPTPNINS